MRATRKQIKEAEPAFRRGFYRLFTKPLKDSGWIYTLAKLKIGAKRRQLPAAVRREKDAGRFHVFDTILNYFK